MMPDQPKTKTMLAAVAVLFVWLPQSLATPVGYGCNVASSAKCRWLYPCSGSEVLEMEVEELEEVEESVPASKLDLNQRLEHLATDCHYMKSHVTNMLRDYISKRISESEVRNVEQLSQHLSVITSKLRSHSQTELTLSQSVFFAYEDLAKFAIILERMRLDEANEISAEVHFETQFLLIEEGVYLILCKLAELMNFLGISLPSEAIGDIGAVELPSTDRDSIRHVRDFVNLRDLEMTLDAARSRFSSFANPKKH